MSSSRHALESYEGTKLHNVTRCEKLGGFCGFEGYNYFVLAPFLDLAIMWKSQCDPLDHEERLNLTILEVHLTRQALLHSSREPELLCRASSAINLARTKSFWRKCDVLGIAPLYLSGSWSNFKGKEKPIRVSRGPEYLTSTAANQGRRMNTAPLAIRESVDRLLK